MYIRQHHVALLALFIALGGTAVAFTLPDDSVRSRHIVNGQVKRPDLADNTVPLRIDSTQTGCLDPSDTGCSRAVFSDSGLTLTSSCGTAGVSLTATQVNGDASYFWTRSNGTVSQGEQTSAPFPIGSDNSSTGANGTIIYRTASATITIPFHIQIRPNAAIPTRRDCTFYGTAISAS